MKNISFDDWCSRRVFSTLPVIFDGTFNAQKLRFSIKDFFSKRDQIRIIFTEETFNGKLHFLCSFYIKKYDLLYKFVDYSLYKNLYK